MLRVLEAPEDLPIPIEEVREYCRAPLDESDDRILERCLKAAISFFQDRTGQIVAPTLAEYRLDEWPCEDIRVPYVPVREVRFVKYVNEAGDEVTYSAPNWSWERTDDGALITWSQLATIPATHLTQRGVIRIQFLAGYDIPGDSGSDVDPAYTLPEDMKIALLMLTSHWYDMRGLTTSEAVNSVPVAFETLMNRFRVFA